MIEITVHSVPDVPLGEDADQAHMGHAFTPEPPCAKLCSTYGSTPAEHTGLRRSGTTVPTRTPLRPCSGLYQHDFDTALATGYGIAGDFNHAASGF
jgi:hypothetical protein